MIFAFGNSHVSIFSGTDLMVPIWPERSQDKLPWFKTFRIGAVTAYQAMRHLDVLYEICEKCDFDKKSDLLLFVFGEVDIRAHIIEQSKKQDKSRIQITREVVDRYYEAIRDVVNKGYTVAVFGCVGGFKRNGKRQEPPWPYAGTCKDRNAITQIFNDAIEKKCLLDDIPFISIFEEMLFTNGVTDIRYLDEERAGCHITTKMLPLILWKFRDLRLIPFNSRLCEWEGV
jgi:hypothetical protein